MAANGNTLPYSVWEGRAKAFIKALEANREMTMAKATEAAGIKYMMYRQIRKKVPWFNEALAAERIARGSKTPGGSTMQRYEHKEGNEDKFALFLQKFIGCKSITEACRMVNEEDRRGTPLRPQIIGARINPSSNTFDAGFYDRFVRAEGTVLSAAYDGLILNATTPSKRGPGGDTQAQVALLRARAPDLFEPRRKVEINQTSRTEHLSLNVNIDVASEKFFPKGKVVEIEDAAVPALKP